MTQDQHKLENCPFCGYEAAINSCTTTDREFIEMNGRGTGYGVNCIRCGVNNRGIAVGYATKEEAVAAWNRRAHLQQRPLPVESYVRNCHIQHRGEVLFREVDGAIFASLDGYAIIPKEDWERLNEASRPLPEDEASIPIQCKKCLAITNEGNGCELEGCPVGVRPLTEECEPIIDRDDRDGELLIDWSPKAGRMLTLSLREDGRLSYAFHWDGEKAHGTAQMPVGERPMPVSACPGIDTRAEDYYAWRDEWNKGHAYPPADGNAFDAGFRYGWKRARPLPVREGAIEASVIESYADRLVHVRLSADCLSDLQDDVQTIANELRALATSPSVQNMGEGETGKDGVNPSHGSQPKGGA